MRVFAYFLPIGRAAGTFFKKNEFFLKKSWTSVGNDDNL